MSNPEEISAGMSMRVLHVDDEPMICDVTRLCLERSGKFTVDVVNSPSEALERLKQEPYACIISDYEMPSMNGLELLKEIRSFDPDIPFILFSGRGRETVVIEAINSGADFYIQKGGDPKSLFAELNHKVDYAISKRNSRIALKRRDAILEAISLVATLFLSEDSFDAALSESITLFGLATEVDKVLVFRHGTTHQEDEKAHYECICAWNRLEEVNPADMLAITPEISSEIIEIILKGKPVIGSSVTLPDNFVSFLHQYNIKTLALYPIISERDVIGMISFCDCLSERVWAPIEIEAVMAASSIIGSAIRHNRLQSKLVAAKEQYESMYTMMHQLCDSVPDMLWAKDLEDKFIFANKEAIVKLPNCLQSQSHWAMVDSDSPASYLKDNDRSSPLPIISVYEEPDAENQGTRRYSAEWENGGEPVYIDIKQIPFHSHDGEILGTVAVGRDVTDERRREDEINDERKKYSAIFQQIPIGLITCSPCGTILNMNDKAIGLLSCEKKSFQGLHISVLSNIADKNLINDFSKALIQKETVYRREEFTDINGDARTLHYQIQPLLNDDSVVTDLLITIDEHYQQI
jgi:CheY-like chemotaxis protein/PAS domain-containing protein